MQRMGRVLDRRTAPRPAVNSATQKAVPHPPLVVDGNASFSNYHLAGLVLGLPLVLIKLTPFLSFGFWTYTLYTLVFGLPITCAYWILSSVYGPNIDKDIKLPNRPQSDYFTINDPNLREQYLNRKIPMQVWHDAYFDGKIDINSASRDRLLRYGLMRSQWTCSRSWNTVTTGRSSTSTGRCSNTSSSPWCPRSSRTRRRKTRSKSGIIVRSLRCAISFLHSR